MFLDGGRKPENPERTRREPGENPRIHGENMQTPHRKNQPPHHPAAPNAALIHINWV